MPNRVPERAQRFAAENFIAFMDRLESVAHAAFTEQLWLTEVWVPAGTADPAAHHEAAARHAVDIAWRRTSDKFQNLVANLRGAALVSIQAENPVAAACLDGVVAQLAKPLKWHLYDARAKRRGNVGSGIGAVRIDHDNFVGPKHTFRRGLELLGFVIRENIG